MLGSIKGLLQRCSRICTKKCDTGCYRLAVTSAAKMWHCTSAPRFREAPLCTCSGRELTTAGQYTVLAITSGHRTISGQFSQLSVQRRMWTNKISGQKREGSAPLDDLPPPKKRDVSLAIVNISGRYPLHAEDISTIRAQMQKRLRSYMYVRVRYRYRVSLPHFER